VLLLIHTLCNSLQHTLKSPQSAVCVHQLSGNSFQQCPLLPWSRSYQLVTVSQLSTFNSTQLHWSSDIASEQTQQNTLPLLMWVAWYHVFHCSGTVRLVPDGMATLLPAALLLLCDITVDEDMFLCCLCIHCSASKLFTVL
jgi:hypothetical protein